MTEVFHSAEVRWFLREESGLANRLWNWFAEGKEIASRIQTDSYLLFPGCESIGVKLREGRFEIKAIRGASETVHYGPDITGRADTWVKWSHKQEGVDSWIKALGEEPEGWIQVKKERWIRKFSLDTEKTEEAKPNEWPDEGCNAELTAVQAGGSNWWTIAFEAFGTANTVRNNLHLVAEHFFLQNVPPIPLYSTNSCSYPVWLHTVA
jgi:hypothetical protein